MNWQEAPAIRVFTNGISFEVFSAGSGDRLALCLHGFPECAYSWRYQFPLLVSLGYRVWAPNLRGYGSTDSPAAVSDYKLEKLVLDVAGLIQESKAKEVVLVAHDWGAALAWTLAMQRPEFIHRLIICNMPHPACFLRELKRPTQFLRSWYIFFFQIPRLPEWLIAKLLTTMPAPKHFSKEAFDIYRQNGLRPGGLTAMLNWYRALLRYGAWREFEKGTFTRIKIPTLFIWGAADTALSIRTTIGTDKYVLNLVFKVLPGISHWVQEQAPETVNEIISLWLQQPPVLTGV